MKRFLVVVAAFLSMACTEAELLPDGTLLPALTMEDLDAGERAAIEETLGGFDAPEAFRLSRCDLAGDGAAELVVTARGVDICDPETGACPLWIVEETDAGWAPVMEGQGQLRIAYSFSMGRPDLVTVMDGLPPIVHKFDGHVWRAELEGLVYGELLSALDAPAGGASFVDWGAAQDPEVLSTHADRVNAESPADFTLGVADLDGDGKNEIFLRGETLDWCATGGCRHWAYAVETGGLRPIFEADGSDAELLATRSNGWRDIGLWTREGLAAFSYDGAVYR
ncbi:MAG: hypothetical protein ACPGID_01815 [Rubricella sp.]